jgi:hypothetical protein
MFAWMTLRRLINSTKRVSPTAGTIPLPNETGVPTDDYPFWLTCPMNTCGTRTTATDVSATAVSVGAPVVVLQPPSEFERPILIDGAVARFVASQ